MFSDDLVKNKISETKKQQYVSGDVLHPWLGKTHSEETKQKISTARIESGASKGENNPMYGKLGKANPNYGLTRSEQTKELMADIKSSQWLDGKYNGVNFKSFYKKGKYFSNKLNKEVFYRSSYEKEVYEFLDTDSTVLTYLSEPVRIRYEDGNQGRYYLPDLLITYNNGSQKLVEIKPKYLVSTIKNQSKFKAARQYCDEKGIIFEVWTEETIESLKNSMIRV